MLVWAIKDNTIDWVIWHGLAVAATAAIRNNAELQDFSLAFLIMAELLQCVLIRQSARLGGEMFFLDYHWGFSGSGCRMLPINVASGLLNESFHASTQFTEHHQVHPQIVSPFCSPSHLGPIPRISPRLPRNTPLTLNFPPQIIPLTLAAKR